MLHIHGTVVITFWPKKEDVQIDIHSEPPNSKNINSWHSWCMTARREMVEMAEGSVVKNRKIDLVWKERNTRE